MRHETQDWSFVHTDRQKHRDLVEHRRKEGGRIWMTSAAIVLIILCSALLLTRFL